MIFECNANTNLEINVLMDLKKLKPFIGNGMKVNYSRLARKFDIDRRTIKKYCLGFTKKQKNLGTLKWMLIMILFMIYFTERK